MSDTTMSLDVSDFGSFVEDADATSSALYLQVRLDPEHFTNSNRKEDSVHAWSAKGGLADGKEPQLRGCICQNEESTDGGESVESEFIEEVGGAG